MARAKRSILSIALGMLAIYSLPIPVTASDQATGSFTVPLTISNVTASNIGVSYATISWETNDNATSQVFYDTQMHASIADYVYHSPISSALVAQHHVDLTGLSSATIYHYRVKSVIVVDSTEFIAVSPDYTFRTQALTGGDGGITYTLTLSEVLGSNVLVAGTITLDSTGTALSNGQITTSDGKLTLKVNAGTRLLDSMGQPLTSITIGVPAYPIPSSSPELWLMVYDLSPSGAMFIPPLTLTMYYASVSLPPGVLEDTLYIAYWDGAEWQDLPSTVDIQAKTVTALVSHFTLFALMGQPIQSPTSTTVLPPISTSATVPVTAPTTTSTSATVSSFTPTSTSVPAPVPTTSTFSPGLTSTLPAPASKFMDIFARWWVAIGILGVIVIAVILYWFVFKRRRRKGR